MSRLTNKLYFKAIGAMNNALKLMKNEKGETNLIAIILILAIVLVLVLLFKTKLTKIFNDIWDKIGGNVGNAIN